MTARAKIDDAQRALRFFRECLTHSKGEHAGESFDLLPWQEKFLRDVFGTKRADGSRQYRQAYLEVPRKNGKSTLGAGIALYLLLMDREPGAEIYSAAADAEQASLVFAEAKSMIESNPALAKRCQVYRRAITVPSTGSVYKVLSAEAYSKHGLNAHGIIFDEVHAQPNRELWDVLNTSTGARRQPLTLAITTAGYDRHSICWGLHVHAKAVLDGTLKDESFYGTIFSAEPDDDWRNPETWAKANPSLGQTVKREYLEQECARAVMIPAYENTFRRLHLNQWTEQDVRWLPLLTWDACAGEPIDVASLAGRSCFGGLDMSTTTDISALVRYFPSDGDGPDLVVPTYWLAEDTLRERSKRDRVPYDQWAREGLINVTPGNAVDYGRVRADVLAMHEHTPFRELAFDRWNISQLTSELKAEGVPMVLFGQGFASMSPAAKELERRLLGKAFRHGGDPVLRWMAGNVAAETDAAGNIKPSKKKSTERIDGIVALTMAIGRAMVAQTENAPGISFL